MYSLLIYITNPTPLTTSNISSNSSWAKFSDNCWIIKTYLTASQVRDGIRQISGFNGTVLVIDVTGRNWATFSASDEVNSWLKQNL